MLIHRVGIVLGSLWLTGRVHSDFRSASAPSSATELVATLSPVGGSRIAGLASLKSGKDSSQINATIEIRGAPVDGQHPWQIRNARCGENNAAIEGAVAMYRKLSVRADGTANVRQTLSIAMPNPATQSITVSRSSNEVDVIVACGNLSNK